MHDDACVGGLISSADIRQEDNVEFHITLLLSQSSLYLSAT